MIFDSLVLPNQYWFRVQDLKSALKQYILEHHLLLHCQANKCQKYYHLFRFYIVSFGTPWVPIMAMSRTFIFCLLIYLNSLSGMIDGPSFRINAHSYSVHLVPLKSMRHDGAPCPLYGFLMSTQRLSCFNVFRSSSSVGKP